MLRPVRYFILCLVVFLQTGNAAFTQTAPLSVTEWAKKLSDPADKQNNCIMIYILFWTSSTVPAFLIF